jgi:hypothetical protein
MALPLRPSGEAASCCLRPERGVEVEARRQKSRLDALKVSPDMSSNALPGAVDCGMGLAR